MKNKSSVVSVPYLLWMVLFIVLPLGLVLYFALTTRDGQFTLDNLARVGEYTSVIMQSITLAIIATTISLIIAYPLAFIMSRSTGNAQRTFMMLIMLPMWMNFLLRTYAWMTILERGGLINQLLGFFGIEPLAMINTPGAVVLGMIYNFLPFMILPLYTTMVKIENSVIEAAQDLGAGTFGVLSGVILPLSMPGITTGITMVFVPCISTFAISRMLGGGSFMLVGDLIELQFLGNTYNPNLGSAISLVLMVIVLICMAMMNMFDDSEDKEEMLL